MSSVDPAAAALTINEWLTDVVVTSNQGFKIKFAVIVSDLNQKISIKSSGFGHRALSVSSSLFSVELYCTVCVHNA